MAKYSTRVKFLFNNIEFSSFLLNFEIMEFDNMSKEKIASLVEFVTVNPTLTKLRLQTEIYEYT